MRVIPESQLINEIEDEIKSIPENEIINLDTIEGLDTLDNELSQVDIFGGNNNDNQGSQINSSNEIVSLTETPTLEKDVSTIKKIRIETSELTDEDRKKKEVLRKYGRKKNFNFFSDSLESDDEF